MKQYDHIEYYGNHWGIPVIAFDKLDGSNLRLLCKNINFYLCISKIRYAENENIKN